MTDPTIISSVIPVEPERVAENKVMQWLYRGQTKRPISYRRHQYPQIAIFLFLTVVIVQTQVDSLSAMRDVDLWLVYSIAAIGFYWVFGLAGRFAFCHTFMMGLGAFTSAYVSRQGVSPWFGILAAVLVTALVATIIGLACHRASHFYFAIATLAVSEIGAIVFMRADGFTGSGGVVSGVPPLSSPWGDLVKDQNIFWLLLLALGIVLILAVWIDRSPIRRRLIAVRENEMVARTSGIPAGRLQLSFFALGSSVAGFSGALIGSWTSVVSTDTFGIDLAIGIFLMVILGGLGSHWGAVTGAAFYIGIPRVLDALGAAEYQSIIYSVVLLLTIILVPDGIVGSVQRGMDWTRSKWYRERGKTPEKLYASRSEQGSTDARD